MELRININPKSSPRPRLAVFGLGFKLPCGLEEIAVYTDTRLEDIDYIELSDDAKRLLRAVSLSELLGNIVITSNNVFISAIDADAEYGLDAAVAELLAILQKCFYPHIVDIQVDNIQVAI